MNLSPDSKDNLQGLAFSSALDQGSSQPSHRSHPISGVEELGQGSRREIYLWDSGKGWGNLSEVPKPRSGVIPGSVIYLEWDNVSDRREKNKKPVEEVQIRPLGWELLDDPSQGTDSWISLTSPFK